MTSILHLKDIRPFETSLCQYDICHLGGARLVVRPRTYWGMTYVFVHYKLITEWPITILFQGIKYEIYLLNLGGKPDWVQPAGVAVLRRVCRGT